MPELVMATIGMARENFRTTRDIVPTEAWQCVNELHIFARSQLRWAVGQRRRHEILSEVVSRIQQIRGILHDTMSHGPAFQFLRIGTGLERADMCTRIIDVAVASLLQNPEHLRRFDNTLWMSTLKSLSAYQMYRQYVRRRIRGPNVLAFLFQDAEFPRSILHCLLEIERCLERLPNSGALTGKLYAVTKSVTDLEVGKLDIAALHAEVDRLQVALADLNTQMSDAWFRPESDVRQSAS